MDMPHPLSRALPRIGQRFWLRRLLHRIFAHEADRRARARLATLEPHLLRDIGLTQDQALEHAQAARPDWDAPGHWRRP